MKIGLFDSGLGGLTVLTKILEKYKDLDGSILDLVYLADTINAPYGAKSQQELKNIINKNIDFLYKQNCDFVVIACNSASIFKNHTDNNTNSYLDNCIDMVTPTVNFCKDNLYKNNLIFATTATINSNIYKSTFQDSGLKLDQYPLSELASLIDNSINIKIIDDYIKAEMDKFFAELNILEKNTLKNQDNIFNILEKNITPYDTKYDSIILGCTHYPLVINIFEKYCRGIKIINPADPVSDFVISKIKKLNLNIKNQQILKNDKNSENQNISENKNKSDIILRVFLTKKSEFIEKYILENIKLESLEMEVIKI